MLERNKFQSLVIVRHFGCEERIFTYGKWPLWIAFIIAKIAAMWHDYFVVPKFYWSGDDWERTEYGIYWAIKDVGKCNGTMVSKSRDAIDQDAYSEK